MPLYETSFIVRQMAKNNTAKSMVRIASAILDRGGYIQKIDYLGLNTMPERVDVMDNIHDAGSYFVVKYHLPHKTVDSLIDHYKRELDIVKRGPMVDLKPEEPILCEMESEMLPPAYRSEVKVMLQEADDRRPKPKLKQVQPNTGLDHYPFN